MRRRLLNGVGVLAALGCVGMLPQCTVAAYAQATGSGGGQPAGQGTAQQPEQPPPPPPPPPRIRPGERPARPYRGLFGGSRTVPDPNRTRQELEFTFNLQGGYDDNVAAGEGSGGGPTVPLPTVATSGYTGYVEAALDYFYGNGQRSLRAGGAANLRAYPGYLDSATPGGNADVEATTTLGRRSTLTAAQRVAYEPFFAFGLLESVAAPPSGDVVPTTPTIGLFEQRSLNSDSSVSLERRWSRRDSTIVGYSYLTQVYVEGVGGDNRSHAVSVDYRRTLSRRLNGALGYRYSNGESTDLSGITRPLRQHTVEGGPEYSWPLSSRRTAGISVRGGATRFETTSPGTMNLYDYWTPSGSATVFADVADSWRLGATYDRSLSVLEGLTNQSYYTNNASLDLDGDLSRRATLALRGTFSDGRTPSASGANSTYRIYGAATVLSVAVSRGVAATAAYDYYYHRYSNPADLPEGFPPEYDRHAVRVGLVLWVPLIGTYLGPSR